MCGGSHSKVLRESFQVKGNISPKRVLGIGRKPLRLLSWYGMLSYSKRSHVFRFFEEKDVRNSLGQFPVVF